MGVAVVVGVSVGVGETAVVVAGGAWATEALPHPVTHRKTTARAGSLQRMHHGWQPVPAATAPVRILPCRYPSCGTNAAAKRVATAATAARSSSPPWTRKANGTVANHSCAYIAGLLVLPTSTHPSSDG